MWLGEGARMGQRDWGNYVRAPSALAPVFRVTFSIALHGTILVGVASNLDLC